MMKSVLAHAVAGMLVALALPGAASTQNVLFDEGTFVVYVDGVRAGTEAFSIRRSGSGQDMRFIATGQIRLRLPDGNLNLDPAMELAGQDRTLAAYQVKVSGTVTEEIAMSLSRDRLVARVRSQRGEQVREYRFTPTLLLLERLVAHQYFLLHERANGTAGAAPVIVPRGGRQHRLTWSFQGEETVRVGARSLTARLFALEGGEQTRKVWLDEDGRVLRVTFADGSYLAERQAPPG